jgi:RHS repeat-associated protein
MKPILKLVYIVCAVIGMHFAAQAQSVDIYPKHLPYTIPVLQGDTTTAIIQWRWLENGIVIPGADSSSYTIPVGKPAGSYAFVNQVRCEQCTDWLSSNPFTVIIHPNPANRTAPISVTFSPQGSLHGYTDELISVIDNAQRTLEISLYNFETFEVYKALERATARGVKVRFLFEGAQEDRASTEGTVSHQIEKLGADVRYVNKINHHKFLIADADFLVSSSGNWDEEANWVYDENTLWINEDELVLRFRIEFEHLWNHSRPFGEDFGYSSSIPVNTDSLQSLLVDNGNVGAVFTSSNYRTYTSSTNGETFALISGNQKVADKVVALINAAKRSIRIAANHLRSRPISQALIAKKNLQPGIDISVYLDGQEYVSKEYNDIQIANRDSCLAQASTAGAIRNCREKNFYYSYELIKAGIDVRFKTYAHKWHPNTAALMHHKYAIFDDSVVATGSYNYSYNAETNSMENVVVFDNVSSAPAVADFINNFQSIWNTGRAAGFYTDIQSHISSSSRYVPVLFPSMALSHDEVKSLKASVELAAPTVKDTFFNANKEHFSTYLRGVGMLYDANNRLITTRDDQDQKFISNYAYNEYDALTAVSFQSNDSLTFQESYQYDQQRNLVGLNSPQFDLTLTYLDSALATLDAGQGAHAWTSQETGTGSVTHYSTPSTQNYLSVEWNQNGFPIKLNDADAHGIYWAYNADDGLATIKTADQNIVFINNEIQQKAEVVSTNGEGIGYQQPNINELTVSTTGTVNATIQHTITELADKKSQLSVQVNSTAISSGKGKTAAVEYLLDAYGRVIQSGNMTVVRKPYSGLIVQTINEGITETRSYNDWELLTSQRVTFQNQLYYEARYEYDGLQRIKSAFENIQGDTARYAYSYTSAGQLETVYTNHVLTEHYQYDAFGNRTAANTSGYAYSYQYAPNNRLTRYSWPQSGNTRIKEFAYNNSGQLLGTVNKTDYGSSQQVTSSRNYNYDVFGNLKGVAWASQTEEYRQDAYDRRIATYANGAIKSKLVYGVGLVPIAELNEYDRIINTFVYTDNYTPVLMRKGTIDYYIVSDIRGSVRMVVKSSTGEVRQRIKYDAFGKTLSDSNPGYTPFGFAGGLHSTRTDLVRFGARDYSPETGRWTAEDPIGFLSGGINFYAYVANDPVNFVDPSGLSKVSNSNLAIVIGERMIRVNNAANELRSMGYNVKTYNPRNFRSTPGNLSSLDIKANRSWLSYWTQKMGAKVFDIGIDKSEKNIRSPFYGLENRCIYDNWKYNNVVKLPGY